MNVGSFQIFQQSGVYKISYLTSQLKIVYHVLIWINIHMGTLQTAEVCSSMETSEVYTVKAPDRGDANSGHLRIADIFSWNGRN